MSVSFKYTVFSFVLLAILSLSLSGCTSKYKINDTKTFKLTDEAIVNPFMGFAINAENDQAVGEYSLVYIDITFKELQPDNPDEFDFESIENENNIKSWKEQGKHAVLRFICDYPSDESHSDIPDWLMELTDDGTYYDTSYGMGYSPDYNNETFIYYHEQAIKALAEYFDDGFVSYVQLGSLGHWGEWHIKQNEGLHDMPDEKIREEYISHYTSYFTNAKLLMRRPFNAVAKYNLGLYNDMFGSSEDTNEWLDWINYGGKYSHTKNALSPVPDFWKFSPSGGELTSSIPMEDICGDGLEELLELMKQSHTTFIGPKTPVSLENDDKIYKNATEKIMSLIGYRIGISEVSVIQALNSEDIKITLKWENNGIAPIYFDLPVSLYKKNTRGEFKKIKDIDIKLSEILPGEAVYSETVISADSDNQILYIGISDPMTNKPSVNLVSNQNTENGYIEIYKFR